MSTPTDVLPGAGWYRDPTSPGAARWWDGSGWTDQTQALPQQPPAQPVAAAPVQPAAAAPAPLVAPAGGPETGIPSDFAPEGYGSEPLPVTAYPPGTAPADALIAIAAPAEDGEVSEPKAPRKPKFTRPALRLPRLALPGSPVVALLLVVLLAGGGWYVWTSMVSSSAKTSTPTPTAPVVKPPAAKPLSIAIPKTAPSDLSNVPWDLDGRSRSLAAQLVSDQRPGGHRVIASYYGQAPADRFFFLGSTVQPADLKKVSAAVERTRLVHLLNGAIDGAATASGVVHVPTGVTTGSMACVTGKLRGDTFSLCSWQNSSSRVVVSARGPVANTEARMVKVLSDLGH